MRKRSLKRRTAFILAVLMMFMNCFSSYASETGDTSGELDVTEGLSDTDEINIDNNKSSDDEQETGNVISASDVRSEDEESIKRRTGEPTDDLIQNSYDGDDVDNTESGNDIKDDYLDVEVRPESSIGSSMAVSKLSAGRIRSVMALGASGEEDTGDGIWHEDTSILWRVSENILYISKNEAYTGTSFVGQIPNYGRGDTRAPWIEQYGNIIGSIRIGDGITKIGTFAFFEMENVGSISIPNSVTDIDTGALSGLKNLASFGLDDNPNFYVDDGNRNGTGAIYKKYNGKYSLLFYPIKGYPQPFVICESINGIEVNQIKGYACYNCFQYGNALNIPKTITEIGSNAFYNCSEITEIIVGGRNFKDPGNTVCNLTTIGATAFGKCTSLKKVTFPRSVTNVPSDILKDVTGLEYIIYFGQDINDTKTKLENNYSSNSHLDSVENVANDGRAEEDYVTSVMVPYDRCIVYFDINGASKINNKHVKPITVKYNESINEDLPDPVRDGADFTGWYNLSTKYTSTAPVIINDVTLLARWMAAYNITFRTQGGTFSDNEVEKIKNAYPGTKFKDWPDNPQKEHATFVGWYDDATKYTYVINKNVPKKYATKKIEMSEGTIFKKDAVLTAVYINMIPTTFRSPEGSLVETIYVSP
ncbi:MAG: leucine-rich repeat protein, partial [Lachnospiraceae bacterium]|nr:leucine-rich repeat protein [Lachnospiraceae bacterium]